MSETSKFIKLLSETAPRRKKFIKLLESSISPAIPLQFKLRRFLKPFRGFIKPLVVFQNVDFDPGEDVRKKISEADVEKQESKRHWDTLFRAFKCALQMRNSVAKSTSPQDDWIASPVKAADGSFFDSREQPENSALPRDADANGAYHIALKGLMGVRKNFASGWQKNETWFEFVQKTLRERS